MSKIYPIIVFIVYLVMVYMWIMVVIRKNYLRHYLPRAIGVSVGFLGNMIAAIINSNVADVAIYVSAIFLLLIICIFISVHCKSKEKKEKTAIRERIISSPIYKAVIDEFNQNNYGALYVCSDGVAFCRDLFDLSFPKEIYTSYADSEIIADRIAKQRAEKWKQENSSTTGISLIPAPICSFPYSTFGYADMGEKEISAFTELIAENLNIDRRYFTKSFYGEGGSMSFGPTGAVTLNGTTKFTGNKSEDYYSGFYSLIVIGAVYRKGAVLPKQELKSW